MPGLKRPRLLALDLDGTALDSAGTLTPRVRQALSTFARGGGKILFATGQSYATAVEHAAAAGDGCHYLSASQGAILAVRDGGEWRIDRSLSTYIDGSSVASCLHALHADVRVNPAHTEDTGHPSGLWLEYWVDLGDCCAYTSPDFFEFNADLASIGDNRRNLPNPVRCE